MNNLGSKWKAGTVRHYQRAESVDSVTRDEIKTCNGSRFRASDFRWLRDCGASSGEALLIAILIYEDNEK